MAFAQPLALAFFALFVPIVLLYLLKQRRRRVQVATLLFWDQILRDEHRVASITRLRKLLSLLLQLLVVSLLTLALARPLLSKDLLGARRVVIVIDTSASMSVLEDGGTRIEAARERAAAVVRGLSLGDTAMVVTAGAPADIAVPFTGSRRELLAGIEALDARHTGTAFDEALSLLGNLPPDPRETHVHFITDGAFDSVAFEVPERMRFAYLPIGAARDNVGITAFQLRPLPASPRDFEIRFEAVNASDEPVRTPFELRVDGQLIDAGELDLPPGEAVPRTVRQFSLTGGEVELAIDFDDPYALDNRAYAVLPAPQPIPVLLVTPGNLFLESALQTDDYVELETVTPEAYGTDAMALERPLSEYLVVFDRAAPPEPPPGPAVYIGTWPAAVAAPPDGALEQPLVTDWDRDHPINRHLFFTNVTIRDAVRASAGDGWDVLVNSFEHPLVLYRDGLEAPVLLVAFDTVSSDLPLRVAFPILLANAIRHMSGSDAVRPWESLEAGTVMARSDATAYVPEGHEAHGFEVVAPGRGEEREADGAAPQHELVALDHAGIYRARYADGGEVPLFAANALSREESRIAPSEAVPLRTEGPLPLIDAGFRLGTEPWFLLTVLATALLALEWVLFHRRWVE